MVLMFSLTDNISSQVQRLSFAIIHSTTIALPAWRRIRTDLGLKPKLIPRNVVTRWNSTYDMMEFALKYRKPIDIITADKSLKLRKYELDNDDWEIIGDLVVVLEVCCVSYCLHFLNKYPTAIQKGNALFL